MAIVLVGFLLPDNAIIPVESATNKDWNHNTFWYEPWGKSGVHKGIDIFAPIGKPVISAITGFVIFQGKLGIGGNVIAVLGSKWRVHYYAHLQEPTTAPFFVKKGDVLGKVGTSGNAMGKTPHLHYSIISIVPIPFLYSNDPQGWKKMFFLNPQEFIQ